MLERVPEKNSTNGAGGELVWHGGVGVREAQTTENAKMVIGGVGTVEEKMGHGVVNGTRWSPVEKVSGRVKCLDPKWRGEVGLE